MLVLLFSIADVTYAATCDRVREIVAMPRLKPVPHAPPHFVGVFNYRGRIVPVVDLCMLVRGQPCRRRLSTRIILADAPGEKDRPQVYGLMAERVTETLRLPGPDAREPSVFLPDAPYLGGIMTKDGEMIQFVDLDRLPESLGVLPARAAALPERSIDAD
ncbi:MAG: chemotaxis protein CheW [Thermodesulfobacteriota bacterium]